MHNASISGRVDVAVPTSISTKPIRYESLDDCGSISRSMAAPKFGPHRFRYEYLQSYQSVQKNQIPVTCSTYEWNSDPCKPIARYAGFNTTPLPAMVTSHPAAKATPPAAAFDRKHATVTIPLVHNGSTPSMNADLSLWTSETKNSTISSMALIFAHVSLPGLEEDSIVLRAIPLEKYAPPCVQSAEMLRQIEVSLTINASSLTLPRAGAVAHCNARRRS